MGITIANEFSGNFTEENELHFGMPPIGDETYDQALEDVRKKLTVARNERPVQTATAEIGGSLLPVVGSVLMTPATGGAAAPAAAATTARTAGLVSQMLSSGGKAAAIGAGMGATEGFLKGEGNRRGHHRRCCRWRYWHSRPARKACIFVCDGISDRARSEPCSGHDLRARRHAC